MGRCTPSKAASPAAARRLIIGGARDPRRARRQTRRARPLAKRQGARRGVGLRQDGSRRDDHGKQGLGPGVTALPEGVVVRDSLRGNQGRACQDRRLRRITPTMAGSGYCYGASVLQGPLATTRATNLERCIKGRAERAASSCHCIQGCRRRRDHW